MISNNNNNNNKKVQPSFVCELLAINAYNYIIFEAKLL
jgi:hypothetical protein